MQGSHNMMLTSMDNPFSPVEVGSLTLGWMRTRMALSDDKIKGWYVAVGNIVSPVSYYSLHLKCLEAGVEFPNEASSFLNYSVDLVLLMPVGSIDLSDDGDVDYTLLTVENFLAAFSNFVTIVKSEIQSKLNNETMHDAAETYAKLVFSCYPYVNELSWRGKTVEALEPRSSEILAKLRKL